MMNFAGTTCQACSSPTRRTPWACGSAVRTQAIPTTARQYPPHLSGGIPDILLVFLVCKYGYLGGFCDGAHGATAACKAAIVRISVKMSDGSVKNITSSASTWTTTTTHNPITYSRTSVHSLIFSVLELCSAKPRVVATQTSSLHPK